MVVTVATSIFYFVLFGVFLKGRKAYLKRCRSLLDIFKKKKKSVGTLWVSLNVLICKLQCVWKLEKCLDDSDFCLYHGFEVNALFVSRFRLMSTEIFYLIPVHLSVLYGNYSFHSMLIC